VPSRKIVIESATWKTSSSLWLMKTIDSPLSLRSRTIVRSRATSVVVSAVVGSSMKRIRASIESARAIATSCLLAIERVPTASSSGSSSRIRASCSDAIWRIRARFTYRVPSWSITLMAMFSATLRWSNRERSW
jgi:hypothetical protein